MLIVKVYYYLEYCIQYVISSFHSPLSLLLFLLVFMTKPNMNKPVNWPQGQETSKKCFILIDKLQMLSVIFTWLHLLDDVNISGNIS